MTKTGMDTIRCLVSKEKVEIKEEFHGYIFGELGLNIVTKYGSLKIVNDEDINRREGLRYYRIWKLENYKIIVVNNIRNNRDKQDYIIVEFMTKEYTTEELKLIKNMCETLMEYHAENNDTTGIGIKSLNDTHTKTNLKLDERLQENE